tara:strand:+ start:40806 stop:42071 length:1266 start_codon:yes stop_codon:yes gene_type:complete
MWGYPFYHMNMKKTLLFLYVLTHAIAGTVHAQKTLHPNQSLQRLQDKNYHLFTAFAKDTTVLHLLREDTELKSYLNKFQNSGLQAENMDLEEVMAPFLLNEKAIASIGKRLARMSKTNPAFTGLIQQLRKSNNYADFEKYPDDEFLSKAWELCAKGLDTVLEVYGTGKKTWYAKIDSVSFDVKSRRYQYAVSVLRWQAVQEIDTEVFYGPSLKMALSLLYANHKDEAVRYDPLEENENAKAKQAIKTIDFDAYDYASILVLGGGPENYRDRLSIAGKINLQLAMKEYRAKRAPFIIVSGGHVHPYMTPYCEAVEMKKELMEEYGVPEERIIIEPYARHTTTNMRNATRLMMDYGIPLEKKSLVVTNPSHSTYVESETFKQRCADELGYQPMQCYNRLSPSTLEFRGKPISQHQNPYQPLDP